MAPFNLENNIREKLENRELNPSPDAWEKLEARLGKNQPKKKYRGWYYLAASVVGLLLAVSVFLNRNTVEVENQIVFENVQPKDAIHNEIIIGPESVNSLEDEDENLSEKVETEKEPKPNEKKLKPFPPQEESVIDKKIKKSEVLANLSKEENLRDAEKFIGNPIIDDTNVFNTKVDEVIASVKSLQKKNEEITAEEVETLLRNARRDIQIQKILSSPKVDAAALLQDVEWELEKSFRDKVFDALGEGFQKLRTAISQRND